MAFNVTASNGRFLIDGVQKPELELISGQTYVFDLSSRSVAFHPFQFKLDGEIWTDGVEVKGTLGQDQILQVTVPSASLGTLSYYCANHVGMGNNFNISPNIVNGTDVADTLDGLSGDDVLTGGLGNDLISGGQGYDIATYSGDITAYHLYLMPDTILLTDRVPGRDGGDMIHGIEALVFRNNGILEENFRLDQFSGIASLNGPDLLAFIELYIAYFNRAPDSVGLSFWGTSFSNGVSLEEIASFFIEQEETQKIYPMGTSNSEFVTAVYENVFGRVPDQAGFNFWVNSLDNSVVTGVSRDQFILEALRGVQEGSADREYLDKKVDIGAYFSIHSGMSNIDNALAVMELYDGSQQSVGNAFEAIQDYYQAALDPINGEFLMSVGGVLDFPYDIVF